jgi:hypothetical protein
MSRLALALVLAATAAHARPKDDNLPRGFTWPPSRMMEAAEHACEARLDELGVAWKPAKAAGHVVDPITVSEIGGIAYTAVYRDSPAMDCQLVLALATIAPHLYELGVREIKIGSSKVHVGGKTRDGLSRHALGLAIDVVSFVDDQGREAVVARDYKDNDELLMSIERAVDDTGIFRLVLTPNNDPVSHKDHFHIEANPDYSEAIPERPSS